MVNTIFIFASLYGVLSQVQKIKRRKKLKVKGGATQLLSINLFTVSYLAYFTFFIYGYSIKPFNHYIVWPRLIAAILVGFILYEIWLERRTKYSASSFILVFLSLVFGIVVMIYGDNVIDEGKYVSTSLILVISILLAQGYYHQIKLIMQSGATGAVELKMSQLIFMMDISTIAFAFSMEINTGWPLMVLAFTSAATKIIIMYLFKWVRVSSVARQRRRKYPF